MKGDDRQPAARHQQPLGAGEAALQLAEFVVHRDAQRLKGAGGRIETGLAAWHSRRTMSASSAVRLIGFSLRASTIARATRRA